MGGDTAASAPVAVATPPLAELNHKRRTLYILWEEWRHGIGGRKRACAFTTQERGKKNKHKFHRRLIVWKFISLMVNAGIDSKVAIDHIYRVYGESTSVSEIINSLKKDTNMNTLHEDICV